MRKKVLICLLICLVSILCGYAKNKTEEKHDKVQEVREKVIDYEKVYDYAEMVLTGYV